MYGHILPVNAAAHEPLRADLKIQDRQHIDLLLWLVYKVILQLVQPRSSGNTLRVTNQQMFGCNQPPPRSREDARKCLHSSVNLYDFPNTLNYLTG